ncbi:HET-domain-containing protein, partial [Hyaloscypha variabilis F]
MESVHDRFIPSGVQPRISPAQICLFLQQCEKYHDHSRLDDSRLYNKPITITLVDVMESRLVTGSSRDRYFALSYVWGELSMFQATMTNKPLLEMPGSLNKFAKEIPKLIQDAISFVLAMGERYLWVDSLCIEQDNPSQKHDQISQMDGIYSQAVATIVALSSPSAASALPGVLIDNLAALASYESTHDLGSRAEAKLAASLEQIISESHYETRVWTFQERLLSKRCLLFTNTGVYFQCSEILMLVYNKGFTLRELNFNVLPECILSKNNFGSDWTSAFSGYARLVRDYSKRHLSYASDALNAFGGILKLFKHRFEGDIISGLPVRVLDEALLWVPVNEDAQQRIRNNYFPSWSWAGW